MPDHVGANHHVRDDAPRRRPVLVAHRKQNGRTRLRGLPVVLEEVVLDQHAGRVLQLEQVLDLPAFTAPAYRLRDVVLAEHDIGWHEARDAGIRAAEHHILSSGLEVVVFDEVRPRAVPPVDCLRILSLQFEIREMGIGDTSGRAVERNAPFLSQ